MFPRASIAGPRPDFARSASALTRRQKPAAPAPLAATLPISARAPVPAARPMASHTARAATCFTPRTPGQLLDALPILTGRKLAHSLVVSDAEISTSRPGDFARARCNAPTVVGA